MSFILAPSPLCSKSSGDTHRSLSHLPPNKASGFSFLICLLIKSRLHLACKLVHICGKPCNLLLSTCFHRQLLAVNRKLGIHGRLQSCNACNDIPEILLHVRSYNGHVALHNGSRLLLCQVLGKIYAHGVGSIKHDLL